jgi:CheY-like chemotaxis protein
MTISAVSDVKKKILIIEDQMDMRFFLTTLLETNGFAPAVARNGKEGIEKAKDIHPDIIILDIMMPEEGGAQTYRKLKSDETLKDIPVIILSAVAQHTFSHYLKMLNTSGGLNIPLPDSYIEKPPEPQYLMKTIKRLIAN